ncbi:D-threonine aldolase [Rubripirellula tenax]|uniref:D-threonine aldolase n=1 Tax=Rubripirellula tenax TaxID=2528015 RepID=A0A5C6FG88_9BACT|nr:D-TA family PLP-dependent enzyme [Rubripirellula tenax]TWU59194.1 D-threonine aldolase [Rubripirellula tenax]
MGGQDRFNANQVNVDALIDVPSPGLLIHPATIAANIDRMIEIVGGPQHADRIRPHVKTHKMAELVRMQTAAGIHRFKAATLAEAEMVAVAGGRDVLIAYPMVGPNLKRLAELRDCYRSTLFSVITDNIDGCEMLSATFSDSARPLGVFIDVNGGMHRTGIMFGPDLDRLRSKIESTVGLNYNGLHIYDGHIHAPSLSQRAERAHRIIETVKVYDRRNPSQQIIAGGAPTFAIWADHTAYQCSPGTPLLWDINYEDSYPDLKFNIAAVLLTRVVSKPAANRLCLDLGHKAVASEMPLEKRIRLPELPDANLVGHNEEHLIIETPRADEFPLGRELIALPTHICPSVALHAYATVLKNGKATSERWPVTARDR